MEPQVPNRLVSGEGRAHWHRPETSSPLSPLPNIALDPEHATQPLVLLDRYFRVRSANRAFCDHFSLAPNISNGQLIFRLNEGEWNRPAIHALLQEARDSEKPVVRSVNMDVPNHGRCLVRLEAHRRQHPGTAIEVIHLSVLDTLSLLLVEAKPAESTSSADVDLASTLNGVSRDMNRSFVTLLGASRMLAHHSDPLVREDAQDIACTVNHIQAVFSLLLALARNVDQPDRSEKPFLQNTDVELPFAAERAQWRSTPFLKMT